MILSVGYYHDADDRRRGEIGECLRRNAANPRLAEVHVLLEDDSSAAEVLAQVHPQDRAKVRVVEHRRRLTYADLFAYANAQLRDETVVIANADVFFDDTLGLLDGHDLFGQLLCLSRWDEQPDGTTVYFDHPGSQDAWIFESPVRQMSAGFHLGTPGCDSRIAAEAQRVGMTISNPSRSIVVHHLHRSSVHRYTERDRVGGPAVHVAGHVLPRPRETIYALS
ncbi:MAG: hypothetical protein JWM12_992, partial [Ilumatobacteraceae bacterium]|nr:hypothetical protein [Ilumatobacteraceae bacterium]